VITLLAVGLTAAFHWLFWTAVWIERRNTYEAITRAASRYWKAAAACALNVLLCIVAGYGWVAALWVLNAIGVIVFSVLADRSRDRKFAEDVKEWAS
jgi:hypothetical protein